ncbi:archaellum component FlaC [Clostridium tetanomorphum]|nr:hypothetical protein [Clostridium tetanomorphum]MBP1864220.1 archaellum component FlaC [Clostridium tetanomorphum]NRS83668.1 archaellum component FlaC [Clostridium tetanomorphum]NRZ96860.1 archaellum component FlaC [Clostridium tetanomorphum]SQC02077.1 Uncharacterised protein [Clostridium tetanomorphum]
MITGIGKGLMNSIEELEGLKINIRMYQSEDCKEIIVFKKIFIC